jgi:hypothetical protein
MQIDPAQVQWDDEPAAPKPRARPNREFHNPAKVPASLNMGELYGSFRTQFPSARVTSTRRTPEENARLPNASPDSFHLTDQAWDAVPGAPNDERALIDWGTSNGLQVKVEREPYHVHFEPPARDIAVGGISTPPQIDLAAVQWDEEAPEVGLELDIMGGSVATPEQIASDAALVDRHRNVGPKDDARPSLFRMDSDFRKRGSVGLGTMLGASARDMFAGDDSAAKYLAEKTGGNVEKDAQGNPMLRLKDGTSYRLNDDGLDTTDLANFTGNAAAFFLPASWAARVGQARNLGLGSRAALQGATAGATDAALQATVNGGQVNPGRAGMAALGGAGGEAAGQMIAQGARGATSLSRMITGATRRDAEALGAQMGKVPEGSLAALMRGANEVRAGADPRTITGNTLYGLTYTQGQRLMDPVTKFNQLAKEEVLRQSKSGGMFAEIAGRNEAKVGEAMEGIGTRLGGRPGATPAELAQGAASRVQGQASTLKSQIDNAYGEAAKGKRTAVGVDAVKALPNRMAAAVREYSPNPQLTPAAVKTLEQVQTAAAQAGTPGVKGITLAAIETQRRIINNNIGAAANPTDRAAMTAIKREFDGWLDEAVETALVSGDSQALAALKDARQLRFEYGRRFEGKTDADKFIAGLLDGSKTPEELVNVALGASQVSKAGGARFVERLREAAGNDPEVIGNLRAAHFLRMTQGPTGKPLQLGQIVRNVKATEYSNGSMVKALYSPQEWAEIKRLTDAIEPLLARGDFAKSSGTTERLFRGLYSRMTGNLPLVGEVMQIPQNIGDFLRTNSAINKPLKLPVRVSAAYPAVVGTGLAETGKR